MNATTTTRGADREAAPETDPRSVDREPAAIERRRDWINISFLTLAHTLAVTAVGYMAFVHFSWWTVGLGVLWFALCGVGITGGYHRLFAHAAYKASAPVRFFYLFFGAASVQNSALRWSADHRAHHAYTDTDRDPYSIRRGFWWAHIGWVFFKDDMRRLDVVHDLQKDPLIRWQDRNYVAIAIVAAAILPACLGLLWGDALGAFLVAGFLRLVVQWHATFAVNSLAHYVGKRPYCENSTARDSFWVALVTMGEGYHNFHHRYPLDYRNGVRWYHFDPTKWFVWTLSKTGLVSNLRRAKRLTR